MIADSFSIFPFAFSFLLSVLVASLFPTLEFEAMTSEQILESFFKTYATFNWSEPIFMSSNSHNNSNSIEASGNSPLRIMTPSSPHLNSSRNITPSTLKCLQAEFTRAAGIISATHAAGERPWFELFKPCVAADEASHSYLVLDVSAASVEELDQCSGWLNGHLVTLVLALETKALCIRPFSRPVPGSEGVSRRYHLSLNKEHRPEGSAPISFAEDIQTFRSSFGSWHERPSTAVLKISQVKTLK